MINLFADSIHVADTSRIDEANSRTAEAQKTISRLTRELVELQRRCDSEQYMKDTFLAELTAERQKNAELQARLTESEERAARVDLMQTHCDLALNEGVPLAFQAAKMQPRSLKKLANFDVDGMVISQCHRFIYTFKSIVSLLR